ncbi:peptidoglycan-binding domain-containing protein [Streptomyces sp. NPDC091376]|uniref:peptidoglycan-binding domain-containing protein n=1 Tax=Streptomyces sp. NPDC091376 TaxID=3365994 RepID=UPI00382DF292
MGPDGPGAPGAPEAPRGQDGAGRGGQGCVCAETAAAEGFDPLRVRPYVPHVGPAAPPGAGPAAGPPPELTEVAAAQGAQGGATEDTQEIPRQYAYAYEAGHDAPQRDTGSGPAAQEPGRRRGRRVFLAAAAVVAVLGTAAYASGLLAGDGDGQDRALPDSETMAPFLTAAPDAPRVSSSAVSPEASASASRGASPSASPSASASSEARPSATTKLADAPASPSTIGATGEVSSDPSTPSAPGTLRPGDSGDEVVELQERLEQVWLYNGPSHGHYDGRVEDAVATYQAYRGINGDPEGVYGPETRRALEAETRYPNHGGGWDDDGDGDNRGSGGGRGARPAPTELA